MSPTRTRTLALCAMYGALAALFCSPLFTHPHAFGRAEWDRQLFIYGSVLQSIGHGQLPYWDPSYCGGNVLWQNPEVALLSPVYPIAALTSLALAVKLTIFLHYWLGFLGMHLLLKRAVGLTNLPAIVYLASVFTLSGSLALHLEAGQANFLSAFYLPLVMFFFLQALRTGRIRDALAGGSLLALTVYNGGVEIVPMVVMLTLAVAIVTAWVRRRWQPIAVAVLLAAGGLAYAAPKLIPIERLLTGDQVSDTRLIARHSYQATGAMVLRAYVDPGASQDYGPFEYGNYVGWPAVILAIGSVIWIISKRNGIDWWMGCALVAGLILLVLSTAGDFSPIAPAVLVRHLPFFDRFGFPSRYTVVVPLAAASSIAWALQSIGVAKAPRNLRLLIGLACAAATLQLFLTSRAQFAGNFQKLELEHEARAADAGAPQLTVSRCDDAFQLRRVAESDQPVVIGDEHATLFTTAYSLNRVSARVTAAGQPARIILNQNFEPGWSSNAGPVTADAGTGRPSVVLPAGFSGRVDFVYVPPGLRLGTGILFVCVGLTAFVWRRRIGALGEPPAWLEAPWDSVRARLDRLDSGVAIFLVLVVVVDVHIYLNHPSRPTALAGGWEHFWDQSQYLKSARALARGDLNADQHWYPIGYALLAVPFVHVTPRDPFALVNLVSLSVFAAAFLIYFRPVIGIVPSVAAFLAALAFPTVITTPALARFPIWSQFVIPWSTIPVAAIYLTILCLVRNLESASHMRTDFVLGLLGGLVVIIRPTDALPLAIVAVAYLWRMRRKERPYLRTAAAAAGWLVVTLPILVLTVAIHGGLASPYMGEASRIGMSLSDIHERAYAMLVDAAMTYGEPGTAVLALQPWLYVLGPLAFVWAVNDGRRGFMPIALVMWSLITYLSFNDFWPFNLLRYSLIHYIVWTLPVLTAGGIAGACLLVRESRWKTGLATSAVALALACYRIEPRLVTPASVDIEPQGAGSPKYVISFDTPRDLDAIDLAGASSRDPIGLSRAPLGMVVNEETLEAYRGYRLVLLGGGVRIIFNRHVSARRIEFRVGGFVENLPESPDQIRAIHFAGRFAPFWSPRGVARIEDRPVYRNF